MLWLSVVSEIENQLQSDGFICFAFVHKRY